MNGKKLLCSLLILLSVGVNILLGWAYYSAKQELSSAQTVLSARLNKDKNVNFLRMFIKKVIRSEAEVDFESRLKLENAVRDLGDKEILDQWQKFVNSKDEAETQENVKVLLDLLADKIYKGSQ